MRSLSSTTHALPVLRMATDESSRHRLTGRATDRRGSDGTDAARNRAAGCTDDGGGGADLTSAAADAPAEGSGGADDCRASAGNDGAAGALSSGSGCSALL